MVETLNSTTKQRKSSCLHPINQELCFDLFISSMNSLNAAITDKQKHILQPFWFFNTTVKRNVFHILLSEKKKEKLPLSES